jgi:hypothetical protein
MHYMLNSPAYAYFQTVKNRDDYLTTINSLVGDDTNL